MTQKEFEERTNISLTADEFEKVHAIYMACGDNVDKDEFCKRYKSSTGRLELLHMVTEQRNLSEQAYGVAMSKIARTRDEQVVKNMELAEFLTGKACAYDDSDFYREAVKLVGMKEAVLCKVRMGLPLWEEDTDYINNNLK